MIKPEFVFLWFSALVFGPQFQVCLAGIGTASHYALPYTPTACYGYDPTQFPTTNYFAAAGEGIWENGVSCGRQYLVQCISSAACVPGETVQVRIVDRAHTLVSRPAAKGATIVLSDAAFGAIANPAVHIVNIQFQPL